MRGPSVESRRPYRGYSLLRSTLARVTLTPMCLGRIERLAEVWDDGGTRVARSECGVVLSLGSVVADRPAAALAADPALRHAYLGF